MLRSTLFLALLSAVFVSFPAVQADLPTPSASAPAALSTLAPIDVTTLASTLNGLTSPVQSCISVTKQDSCVSSTESSTGLSCEWCLSKAVPSLCVNSNQASRLPPGVFVCGNKVEEAAAVVEDPEPGAACAVVKDQTTCDSTKDSGIACVWCKCAAVPSSCVRSDMATRLPPSIFACDKPTPRQLFTMRL